VKFKFLAFLLANAISISTHPADAQQPTGKLPRIGYVSGTGDANNSGPNLESFQQSLEILVTSRGKTYLLNIASLLGGVNGSQHLWPTSCSSGVDVLVVIAMPAIRAAQQATKTIPIVIVTTGDPMQTKSLKVWRDQVGISARDFFDFIDDMIEFGHESTCGGEIALAYHR
jgi:hypothetical protein